MCYLQETRGGKIYGILKSCKLLGRQQGSPAVFDFGDSREQGHPAGLHGERGSLGKARTV